MLESQTTEICSPASYITTDVERTSWPESCVPGAIAHQHLEAQLGLARLPQEQGDIRVVPAMGNDIGAGAFELRHQRGEIRRARRIAFPQHDLQAALLGELLRRLRHPHAIRSVLVDDRDLHILWLKSEPCLGVFREKRSECLAILIGVYLGTEHVLTILVLE